MKFPSRKKILAALILGVFCVVLTGLDSWAQTERIVNLQVPFPGAEGGKLAVCNTSVSGEVTCGGISEYIVKA